MRFGIRENLYNEILNLLSDSNVKKAYIFGSRSRGDYKVSSDIDLAIDFVDDSNDNSIKLYSKLEELNTLYKFDVVDISLLKNDKFKQEIEKEWVQIYNIDDKED